MTESLIKMPPLEDILAFALAVFAVQGMVKLGLNNVGIVIIYLVFATIGFAFAWWAQIDWILAFAGVVLMLAGHAYASEKLKARDRELRWRRD